MEEWRNLLTRLIREVIKNKQIEEVAEIAEFAYILKRGCDTVIESSVCCILEKAESLNSEYRYFILKIIDYYVLRCVKFRKSVFENARAFLDLFCETSPQHNPLPGDKKHVKHLKIETMAIVRKWESKFSHDVLLQQIVDFLKTSKAVDYASMNAEQEAIRKRSEKRERKRQSFVKMIINVFREQFECVKRKLDGVLEEMRNAFELLLPNMTISMEYLDQNFSKSLDDMDELRFLKFAKFKNMKSCKVLLETITDNIKLVEVSNNELAIISQKVNKDLKMDFGCSTEELRKIKNDILYYRRKLTMLQSLFPQTNYSDDFVDVEPISADDILMAQYTSRDTIPTFDPDEPSTSASHTIPPPSPSVPTVEFGLDIKYWGETEEKRGKVGVPKNNSDCHRFWRPPDEDTISGTVKTDIYTQRMFTFVGKAPKIEKMCRSVLRNGSLCPRMDYQRCPIHGQIVDRDEKGRPISEIDREIARKEEEARNKAENERITREIELRTGLQLTGKMQKSKLKTKHEKVKNHAEDVRKRLQKKVLSSQAIRRVSKVQDDVRKSNISKKFGHQFSHL